jgi:hypothetical protein
MKVRVPRSADFSLRPTSARADPLRAFKPLNYDNPYLGLRGKGVDRVEHGFLPAIGWSLLARLSVLIRQTKANFRFALDSPRVI